jgi:hypothetical protein
VLLYFILLCGTFRVLQLSFGKDMKGGHWFGFVKGYLCSVASWWISGLWSTQFIKWLFTRGFVVDCNVIDLVFE